jgi:polo-like kinase 1
MTERVPSRDAPAVPARPNIKQDIPSPQKPKPKTNSTGKPDVWVKKWVDYSSKYGVGYILSNGFTGVYFNDATKVVTDPDKKKFDYYEKRKSNQEEVGSTYSFDTFPSDL